MRRAYRRALIGQRARERVTAETPDFLGNLPILTRRTAADQAGNRFVEIRITDGVALKRSRPLRE